jgi:hypothetical protein
MTNDDAKPDKMICYGLLVSGAHGPDRELPRCAGPECSDYPQCHNARMQALESIKRLEQPPNPPHWWDRFRRRVEMEETNMKKMDEVQKLEIKFAIDDLIKSSKKLHESLDQIKDPADRAPFENYLRLIDESLDLSVKEGEITREQRERIGKQAEGKDGKT